MSVNVQQMQYSGSVGGYGAFEKALADEIRSMPWKSGVSVRLSDGALGRMSSDKDFAGKVLGSLSEAADSSDAFEDGMVISVEEDGSLQLGMEEFDPKEAAAAGKRSLCDDLMKQMQLRSDRIRKDNIEFSKKRYKREQRAKEEHTYQYRRKLCQDGLRKADIERQHRNGEFDDAKRSAKDLNAIDSYRRIAQSGRELL